MRAWLKGKMSTIGLSKTQTYPVAWSADGDTRCTFKVERIIIDLCNGILALNGGAIKHDNTFMILPKFENIYITADHHALPSVNAIKNNQWRVDRFEQQTTLLWRHPKQGYDFVLNLQNYWDRYDSELQYLKDNDMEVVSGMCQ